MFGCLASKPRSSHGMLSTGHSPLMVRGGAGLSVLLRKNTGKVDRCCCRILSVHFSFFSLAILSSYAKIMTALQWVTEVGKHTNLD